jgi:hypothetical protein
LYGALVSKEKCFITLTPGYVVDKAGGAGQGEHLEARAVVEDSVGVGAGEVSGFTNAKLEPNTWTDVRHGFQL